MPGATDEELQLWRGAITEVDLEVSFPICCFLANHASVSEWAANREVCFLGLETWSCRISLSIYVGWLDEDLKLEGYLPQSSEVKVLDYKDEKFEVPTSITVVCEDGRKIVDLQMAPARAFLPSLVTSAPRPVLEKLNKFAEFSVGFEGSFSRLGLETISQPHEDEMCYAAVYESKVKRKLLEPSSCKLPKSQISDLNMLDPALTQSETSSFLHFEKARDARHCHCAAYSIMSPDKETFLVV